MTAKSNATTGATGHKLVITRELNKPRERVWKAWTEPSQIKQWLRMGDGMTVGSVQADLRAGGKFRIQQRAADGEYYTAAGTYLEVKEPEKLVYTWDWEKDGAGEEFGELEGNGTQITVEFRETGGRTQLVLTHENFATEQKRDNHEKGWGVWIGKMSEFVEAGQ